jgi:hypothetical protein
MPSVRFDVAKRGVLEHIVFNVDPLPIHMDTPAMDRNICAPSKGRSAHILPIIHEIMVALVVIE